MSVRAKGSMGKMEGVGGVIRKADKTESKTPVVQKERDEKPLNSQTKSNSRS